MAEDLIAGNTQATGEAPAASAAAPTAPAADVGGTQQQATEGQGTPQSGEKPAEGQKSEGDQGEPQGAPEKYEFKAPENSTLNDSVMAAYSEVAKELNLPQEAAQKVLDKVAPVIAAQQAEAFQKVQTEWLDAVKADKEFGGDQLDANVAIAKKALDTFGTPELTKLLNETGLGNNPELIRAFYRAGKAISQDRFVAAGSGAQEPKGADAKVLYPNSRMN